MLTGGSRAAPDSPPLPAAALPEPQSVIPLRNLPIPGIKEAHTLLFADGLLYISDEFNHRILVTDTEGGFIRVVGAHGGEPGRFQYPRGLALAEGLLVVCDSFNNRLQLFDGRGSFLKTIQKDADGNSLFHEPVDARPLAGGLVAVVDRRNHRIVIIDLSGRQMAAWGFKSRGRERRGFLDFERFIEPFNSLEAGLRSRFELYYPNQLSIDGESAWTAGNTRLAAHDALSLVTTELPLGRLVCRRGLRAHGEHAFFLDEVSGGIAVLRRGGGRALLCGGDRLKGFGSAPGGRLAALRGSDLLLWRIESIMEAAENLWQVGKGADQTRESAPDRHSPSAAKSVAAISLQGVFPEERITAEDIKSAIRHLRCGGVDDSLLEFSDQRISALFAETSRRIPVLIETLCEAEEPLYKHGLNEILSLFAILPRLPLLLKAHYMREPAQAALSELYESMSLLAHCREYLAIRNCDAGNTTAFTPPRSPAASCLALLKAARHAARERRIRQTACLDLLHGLQAKPGEAEIVTLADNTARFIVCCQALDFCADLLEDLLFGNYGGNLLGEGELLSLRGKIIDKGCPLRAMLSIGEADTAGRKFSEWTSRSGQVPGADLERLRDSILRVHVAHKAYASQDEPESAAGLQLTRALWSFYSLLEEVCKRHGVWLPGSPGLRIQNPPRLLRYLGFDEDAEAISSEIARLRGVQPSPSADSGKFAATLEELFSSDPSGEAFAESLFAAFPGNPESLWRAVALLRPKLGPDRTIRLVKVALERVEKADRQNPSVLKLHCLAVAEAVISDDKKALPALESGALRAAPFVGDALSEIGRMLAALDKHEESRGYLERALELTRTPGAADDLRQSIYSIEKAAAKKLERSLLCGNDLGALDRADLVVLRDWEDAVELRDELVRCWRTIPCTDGAARSRVLNRLLNLGFAPEAFDLATQWRATRPRSPDIYIFRARAAHGMRRPAEAARILEEHDALFGPTAGSSTLGKELYWSLDQTERAFAAIRRAVQFGESPDIEVFFRALEKLRRGERDIAWKLLASIPDDSPAAIRKVGFLANRRLATFAFQDAERIVRKSLFHFPSSPALAQLLVFSAIAGQRYAEAAALLGSFALLGVGFPAFDGFRGICRLHLEGEEKTSAKRGLRLGLLRLYDSQFKLLPALHYADELLERGADDHDRRFLEFVAPLEQHRDYAFALNAALIGHGDPWRGLRVLDGARCSSLPAETLHAYVRAGLYLKAGRSREAEALGEHLFRFGLPQINLLYARAMVAAGRPDRAKRALATLIKNNPGFPGLEETGQ